MKREGISDTRKVALPWLKMARWRERHKTLSKGNKSDESSFFCRKHIQNSRSSVLSFPEHMRWWQLQRVQWHMAPVGHWPHPFPLYLTPPRSPTPPILIPYPTLHQCTPPPPRSLYSLYSSVLRHLRTDRSNSDNNTRFSLTGFWL